MSEYLNKKAVLEWMEPILLDRMRQQAETKNYSERRYIQGAYDGMNWVVREIQSGRFDAPSDSDRLRAALERIRKITKESREAKYHVDNYLLIEMVAEQALSVTNETTKASEPKYGSKEFPYVYYEDHVDGREIVPEYVVRSGKKRRINERSE